MIVVIVGLNLYAIVVVVIIVLSLIVITLILTQQYHIRNYVITITVTNRCILYIHSLFIHELHKYFIILVKNLLMV